MTEQEITTRVVWYGLQAIITLLVSMTLFLLKKMDAKMDTFQTKENCVNFHSSHREIHALEKESMEKEIIGVKQDVNNIGNIVRHSK